MSKNNRTVLKNIHRYVDESFIAFTEFLVKHPLKILILMILIIAGFISQLPKITIDTSTEGFLHQDDPAYKDYKYLQKEFGRDDFILIALESSQNIFNKDFLLKLERLHNELASKVPHIQEIKSLVNVRRVLGTDQSLIVEDLMERWKQGKMSMDELKQEVLRNKLYLNMFLDKEGQFTSIRIKIDYYITETDMVDILADFDDLDAADTKNSASNYSPKEVGDKEVKEMINIIQNILPRYHSENFKIHLTGSPIILDVFKSSLKSNAMRSIRLTLLIISVLLIVMFRRVTGFLYPLLIVILSLLSTFSLMGIFGVAIKLPTQIIPSLLIAVGVCDSVHLLSIFYKELEVHANKQKAIINAMSHSGFAILITSLTTAAGLASFTGAEISPISDLGFFAAAGVMLALIYTLILLPILITLFPCKIKTTTSKTHSIGVLDRILIGFADLSTRNGKNIIAISALLTVIATFGVMQLHFSHKPIEWLADDEPALVATKLIDDKLRGTTVIEIILDTGKENGIFDADFIKNMEQLEIEIKKIPVNDLFIEKTVSVIDFLREINRALNENQAAFYKIPDTRKMIAQELFLFENSGSDDLEKFVDKKFSKTKFMAKLGWLDAVYYESLLDDIEHKMSKLFKDNVKTTISGTVPLLGRTMHAAMNSISGSYLIACLVITIMMICLIGSFKLGAIGMLANLIPIFTVLGLMGWLRLPLDLYTMLIGSIAIGLVVDDTIHFMHNFNRYYHQKGDAYDAIKQTLLTTGRAMLTTTITLSLGFLTFATADMQNLVNFGFLISLTMILALLADFLLTPALLFLFSSRSHI